MNIDVYRGNLYRAALLGTDVARYDVSDTPHELDRREAPSPLNILAGPQGLWTSDHYHGRLLRLDPTTLKTVSGSGSAPERVWGPQDLSGRNLWVNVKRDQTLALVDGRTGAVLHRVHYAAPTSATTSPSPAPACWAAVLRPHDTVSIQLIDTTSFQVIAHINPGPGAPQLAMPVEIDGQTWIPVGDKLWHLAPNDGWQPDRIVDLDTPHMKARWAVTAFGSIWIATVLPSRILRLPARDLR